ncbi:hypothetical protein BC829DRAFT_414154 [Chytridium lagenaria]|nr:hypothetical protein BC829DRAFT_414154 [Chytridium lagenaria]
MERKRDSVDAGGVAGACAVAPEGGGMTGGAPAGRGTPDNAAGKGTKTGGRTMEPEEESEKGEPEGGTAEEEGKTMGRFNDKGKFEEERRAGGAGVAKEGVEEEEDDEEEDGRETIRDSRGKSHEPSGESAGRGRDWSAERRRGTKVSLFPEELWPRALRACFRAVLDIASKETRSTETFGEVKEGFDGSSEEGGVEERREGVRGRDIGKRKREGGWG